MPVSAADAEPLRSTEANGSGFTTSDARRFPCRIDVRDRLGERPFRAHARRPWMEPFKMKQNEHFIIERKSIELLIAAPETCRFLVARPMLT